MGVGKRVIHQLPAASEDAPPQHCSPRLLQRPLREGVPGIQGSSGNRCLNAAAEVIPTSLPLQVPGPAPLQLHRETPVACTCGIASHWGSYPPVGGLQLLPHLPYLLQVVQGSAYSRCSLSTVHSFTFLCQTLPKLAFLPCCLQASAQAMPGQIAEAVQTSRCHQDKEAPSYVPSERRSNVNYQDSEHSRPSGGRGDVTDVRFLSLCLCVCSSCRLLYCLQAAGA